MVQCGFKPFLALYFAVRFRQNHNCTAPYFCDHMCGMIEFSQNYNHTAFHFCGYMCGVVYKIYLNGLKLVYFSNFGFFLPNSKLIFSFISGQVLNYWASFSLFWVDFPSQHLLGLSNYYYYYLKTRVIKLLIIYLILKINKYINI